ncbi:glutathione-specific gamma-glutamylcyclotransferase [Marchantia polymorpha subsp. ruderalis]|nr:hypothetical protein AXG93_4031s1020 [Marchantia polymorpha subsp. ruderalis]
MVLWVFGYGSLIWKTGFKYDERVVGYIKNYKRAYTQGSIDHRGTIKEPGRTVTLEYEEGAITWGAAYRISGHEEAKMTLAYLDLRERLYDVKEYLNVYTIDSSDKPAITGVLTYIATSNCANLCYLGPAPLEDMASQIATSHGPSGTNAEYLFNLEDALLKMGVECLDDVTRQLSSEVRKMQKAKSGGALNNHILSSSHISSPRMSGVMLKIQ